MKDISYILIFLATFCVGGCFTNNRTCPEEYKSSNISLSCYKYKISKMTQEEAENFCKADTTGGHLVAINSAIENEVVFDSILQTNKAWMGLVWRGKSDYPTDTTNWMWGNRSKMSYIPQGFYLYATRQKLENTGEKADCFAVFYEAKYRFFQIQTTQCASPHLVLCEYNNAEICKNLNDTFNGYCYEFMKEQKRQKEAKEECARRNGGHLVEIYTEEKAKYLRKLLTDNNINEEVWIGLEWRSWENYKPLWPDNTTVEFSTAVFKVDVDVQGARLAPAKTCAMVYNERFGSKIWLAENCNKTQDSFCETAYDDENECETWNNPCLNGATCEDGFLQPKCKCADGYEGTLCQYRTCAGGFFGYMGSCYWLHTGGETNFSTAEDRCKQNNPPSHVLFINSLHEIEYIKDKLKEKYIPASKNFWISGQKTSETVDIGNRRWGWRPLFESGTMFKNTTENYCGYFDYDNKTDLQYYVKVESCGETRTFICEYNDKSTDDCSNTTKSVAYRNSCYRYSSQEVNRSQAEKECRNDAGHLVVIQSFGEGIFLKKHFPSGAWTGFTVPKQPLEISGSEGKSGCVVMNGKGVGNREECGKELSFYCEYNQDINDCPNATICNTGKCVDTYRQWKCECKDSDYEGEYCENWIDDCKETPCKYRGKCTDLVRSYSCTCFGPAFQGAHCQRGMCERHPRICNYRGVCKNTFTEPFYKCHCYSTYKGESCASDKYPPESRAKAYLIFSPVLAVMVLTVVAFFVIIYFAYINPIKIEANKEA